MTNFNPLTLTDFKTEHHPRAYVNSSVRLHHSFTQEERLRAAEKAGWNVFQFPSEMLKGGDLLSDSGTTTLFVEQVAAMFMGDEAYGSNYGYFKLLEVFDDIFGVNQENSEIYLFHQCRAAEHALFGQIGGLGTGQIIPSNGHFDTTRANIESNNMTGIDCFSESLETDPNGDFNGNMNLEKLEELLKTHGDSIPIVYLTITNNTGGGQPVSLENMKAVRALCDKYGTSFFMDVCRFAENTWFIKSREEAQKNKSIKEIVKECFDLCDGFTVSFKKDGLVNMGGGLVIKKRAPVMKAHPELANQIRDHQILTEGHPTYGGLSGREIMTLVEGLKIVVKEEYLDSRISIVHGLGQRLTELNVPVLQPFGGHAIYIDTDRFFEGTKLQRGDFGGVSLTALLLLKGVRLCELGAFAFGEDHPHNFVRCAVPRNKYELEDMYYVADCVAGLYEQRQQIPKAVPVFGKDLTLRHFKARFELTITS